MNEIIIINIIGYQLGCFSALTFQHFFFFFFFTIDTLPLFLSLAADNPADFSDCTNKQTNKTKKTVIVQLKENNQQLKQKKK